MIRYAKSFLLTICIVSVVVYAIIYKVEQGRIGSIIFTVALLLGAWGWSFWANRGKVKSFLSRVFTFSLTRTGIVGERRFVRRGTTTARLANTMIVISYVLAGIVAIVSIINKIKGSDEFAVWEIVLVMVGVALNILGRSLEPLRRAFIKLSRVIKK